MLFLKMIKTLSRSKLGNKECEQMEHNMSTITAAGLWSHMTDSHPKWNSDKRFIANTPPPLCIWPLTALKCWIDLIDAKNMPQKACNFLPSLLPSSLEEMHNQHQVEELADSTSWCHLRLSS